MEGTITRRLNTTMDSLSSQLALPYCDNDLNHAITMLEASDEGNRQQRLENLYDMLEAIDVEYKRGEKIRYYRALAQSLHEQHAVLTANEMLAETERRMSDAFDTIFPMYSDRLPYPGPEEFMKRLVDRLCDPNDKWQENSLRLRILKQFIKYGNYLVAPGIGNKKPIRTYIANKMGLDPVEGYKKVRLSDVLELLDDDVFTLLNGATEEVIRTKYRLLKIADDLSKGLFRTNGITKQSLYLFAIVYNMTFYVGQAEQIYDEHSDIEKNLFQDYYTFSLVRHVTTVGSDIRSSGFVADPVGTGINYKNFAEMIYLYFLCKAEMSREEKIRRASEMIQKVRKKYAVGSAEQRKPKEGMTMKLKHAFSEDVLTLPEEEFEIYILANYNCDTLDKSIDVSGEAGKKNYLAPIEVENTRHTAIAIYRKLIDDIRTTAGESELKECTYGLRPVIDVFGRDSKNNRFCIALLAINSYFRLIIPDNENGTFNEELIYSSITRTRLLAAFYYYFNIKEESAARVPFNRHFSRFQAAVNPQLVEAGYAPFSGRNLLDVVVALSSFIQLRW